MNEPSDQALRARLRELADVTPPGALAATVMRRIAEPRRPGLLDVLLRRRRFEFRFSLAGLALVATTLFALGTAFVASPRPGTRTHAAPNGELVEVRFVLSARGAKTVGLAGDFNGWEPTSLVPVDDQGTFAGTVPLRKGAYEYLFLVDGQWLADPGAAERRPDGFGRENSVLRL